MQDLLDQYFFPHVNDFILGRDSVFGLRERVAGGARGRVLEIGAGTGLNARFYSEEAEVIAIEPSDGMRLRAERRIRNERIRAKLSLQDARAERLPFDSGSFDAVVITFVLCSVKNLEASLLEARRVLKRGGELRLVEHVKHPEQRMAKLQRQLRPIWMTVFGGCDPVRDIKEELRRLDFDVSSINLIELPLPKLVAAGVIGRAIRS